jgi:hypothetical protein
MGTTAAHRRRPGSIVVLSPSAVALALLFLSTTLRLAAAVQPYGGGGPCALAVAPLGYPCEEHQVRPPCFVLLALTLDMTIIIDDRRPCMVHRARTSAVAKRACRTMRTNVRSHASCSLFLSLPSYLAWWKRRIESFRVHILYCIHACLVVQINGCACIYAGDDGGRVHPEPAKDPEWRAWRARRRCRCRCLVLARGAAGAPAARGPRGTSLFVMCLAPYVRTYWFYGPTVSCAGGPAGRHVMVAGLAGGVAAVHPRRPRLRRLDRQQQGHALEPPPRLARPLQPGK